MRKKITVIHKNTKKDSENESKDDPVQTDLKVKEKDLFQPQKFEKKL